MDTKTPNKYELIAEKGKAENEKKQQQKLLTEEKLRKLSGDRNNQLGDRK